MSLFAVPCYKNAQTPAPCLKALKSSLLCVILLGRYSLRQLATVLPNISKAHMEHLAAGPLRECMLTVAPCLAGQPKSCSMLKLAFPFLLGLETLMCDVYEHSYKLMQSSSKYCSNKRARLIEAHKVY